MVGLRWRYRYRLVKLFITNSYQPVEVPKHFFLELHTLIRTLCVLCRIKHHILTVVSRFVQLFIRLAVTGSLLLRITGYLGSEALSSVIHSVISVKKSIFDKMICLSKPVLQQKYTSGDAYLSSWGTRIHNIYLFWGMH